MTSQITTLTEKIAELEAKLEAEFAKRHAELRFGLEKGRIAFEEEVPRNGFIFSRAAALNSRDRSPT